MLAHPFVNDLGLPLLLQAREIVLAEMELPQLALELAVALQAPGRQLAALRRGFDGAAGLALVPAIGEAAALGERLDVGEGGLDALVSLPELDLAQARRVDDQAA